MTGSARTHRAGHAVREFVERYRNVGAVRRAGRTAIVMPIMFALGQTVIGNPTVATFAALGSFAMLLLVDFGGSMRERLQALSTLALAGAVLVCLGTLASDTAWLATAAMAVVAFGVLFAGVVSSVLAGAATALLLAFIIGVSVPGGAPSIPDRLLGWGLASVAALIAVSTLWPEPERDPLRGLAAAACSAVAGRLRSDVAYRLGAGHESATEHEEAVAQASEAVGALHRAFLATPYRPTGLGTAARTTVRSVDELNWMNLILTQPRAEAGAGVASDAACAVKEAAATVLERGSELLRTPEAPAEALRSELLELRAALDHMERGAAVELPVSRVPVGSGAALAEAGDEGLGEFLTSLDPSFRAQELSFAVLSIGHNVDLAAAASRRSWWEKLLGQQPEGLAGPLSAARQRAAAHLERHSVWLHNSLRGAAGLALAVLAANLTGAQQAFWVVFGTLSVLRSNALSTGQNVARGVLGTVVGFALGAAVLAVIGTNTVVLWVLLPVAVLLAGIAPALISFTAGQAAFTLTLVILFNIIQPAGWRLGLIRVEDVALGCAVSLVVGLLFWPRGASAALRKALAEAYADTADYLDRSVTFGAARCDGTRPTIAAPTDAARRAAAASGRLDDTFRTYLAERGAKRVKLAEMTSLITGVAALRLAADAVLDLWQHDDEPTAGDRAAARAELSRSSGLIRDWYDDLAASLVERHPVRLPLAHDKRADGRIIDAVRRDLRGEDGTATATAVRVIWTADHLDAARRLQLALVGPAGAVCTHRGHARRLVR